MARSFYGDVRRIFKFGTTRMAILGRVPSDTPI
jgi:hypothetical protein